MKLLYTLFQIIGAVVVIWALIRFFRDAFRYFFNGAFDFLPKREKKYVAVDYCVKCTHRLSYNEKMDSRSVCPYCGHKNPDSATVCDTITQGELR